MWRIFHAYWKRVAWPPMSNPKKTPPAAAPKNEMNRT